MAPADRILAIGNHVAVEGESPLAMALTAGGTKPKVGTRLKRTWGARDLEKVGLRLRMAVKVPK